MKVPSKPKKPSKIDSPSRHYENPQEVVHDPALTNNQKNKALDTWQVDSEALQRAEDEGMAGGESTKLIDVLAAKRAVKKISESDK